MKVKNFFSRAPFCILLSIILLVVVPYQVNAKQGEAAQLFYIDTHGHLAPDRDPVGSALDTMDARGIRMTLLMPPPMGNQGGGEQAEQLVIDAAYLYSDRFAFLGGGATLNGLIEAWPYDAIPNAVTLTNFESAAIAILDAGAIGFGEMVGEHFSLRYGHPYHSALPDHPLWLLLADIAADYDVPIDLHMEALTENTSRDSLCNPENDLSGVCWGPGYNPNPDVFPANIPALERLLSHNPKTRIVWVHAGWDNTGQRTEGLMRRLLKDHPNLYINIKFRDGGMPELLDLIHSFPDRFMIGTDAKYPEDADKRWFRLHRDLLDQLPPGLARKVAYLNAVSIYKLDFDQICHKPGTRAAQTIWVGASSLKAHLAHGDFLGDCN